MGVVCALSGRRTEGQRHHHLIDGTVPTGYEPHAVENGIECPIDPATSDAGCGADRKRRAKDPELRAEAVHIRSTPQLDDRREQRREPQQAVHRRPDPVLGEHQVGDTQ